MPHTNVKPSPARWAYLKALQPPAPRMLWVSAEIIQAYDPLNPTVMINKVARGRTCSFGSNAAKRARRALRAQYRRVA